MRRAVLALAVLAALASPASSQVPTPAVAEATESLKCAIWASYFSVEYEGEPEEDALANALNYFVGRYEGLTGQGIDQAVDEQLVVDTANALDELTPVCTARMEQYGGRMVAWGKALQEIGKRLPEPGAADETS